jgi:solute carrier family 10 (sodium/bile acid cotransporter), member 7
MYLTSSSTFEGLVPGSDGIRKLYTDVFKQLGCAVFAPFVLGQLIQLLFPKQTKWAMNKLHLNKVGSVCLLLVIWATFSSCFYYQAFENISHQSVILACFLNVGLYVFFTFFSLFVARPPIHPQSRILQKVFFRFSKRDTIAICFCAPAKSVSIGAPLIGVMWDAGFSDSVQSLVMVPIVMYQAEQILFGQVAVILFRRWARDEWMPKRVPSDEETVADASSRTDECNSEEAMTSDEAKEQHYTLE